MKWFKIYLWAILCAVFEPQVCKCIILIVFICLRAILTLPNQYHFNLISII